MSTGRMPLIAGNWKMNLNHLQAIAHTQKMAFALTEDDTDAVEVLVLPPFTDLRSVQTLVDADKLALRYGAQDCSPVDSGAYTGDISAAMLARLGCSYVVVGHSERRALHAETDEVVNAKVAAVIRHGMVPLICVGEGLDVRQEGRHLDVCATSLRASLAGIDANAVRSAVIAYEPVWAIGTGEVATPADAQEVCGAIRDEIQTMHSAAVADGVRVLYGGSVKASNIAGIMAQPDIDGALVGGASLDPDEFVAIARYRRHQVLLG